MAKDCFITSFSLIGINSADLYNATEYDGERLTYYRKKTKDRRLDDAKIIIDVPPFIKSVAMNLIRKLAKDNNYKMSLLIAIGCFTGLKISDILALIRWKQILNISEFTVTEKKTGKLRTIRLSPELQKHIAGCYDHVKPLGIWNNITHLSKSKGMFFQHPKNKHHSKRDKEKVPSKDNSFQFPQSKKDFR